MGNGKVSPRAVQQARRHQRVRRPDGFLRAGAREVRHEGRAAAPAKAGAALQQEALQRWQGLDALRHQVRHLLRMPVLLIAPDPLLRIGVEAEDVLLRQPPQELPGIEGVPVGLPMHPRGNGAHLFRRAPEHEGDERVGVRLPQRSHRQLQPEGRALLAASSTSRTDARLSASPRKLAMKKTWAGRSLHRCRTTLRLA